MSEHEKREQIGKLAEEYSETKGKYNHALERLTRAQQAFQLIGHQGSFQSLTIMPDGSLTATGTPPNPNQRKKVEGLLDTEQLIELLRHRDQLKAELDELGKRLVALAPHLL